MKSRILHDRGGTRADAVRCIRTKDDRADACLKPVSIRSCEAGTQAPIVAMSPSPVPAQSQSTDTAPRGKGRSPSENRSSRQPGCPTSQGAHRCHSLGRLINPGWFGGRRRHLGASGPGRRAPAPRAAIRRTEAWTNGPRRLVDASSWNRSSAGTPRNACVRPSPDWRGTTGSSP